MMDKSRDISKGLFSFIKPEVFFFGLFVVLLLVMGFILYDDFGVHWDSQSQQIIGKANTTYIVNRNASFLEYKNRYYGPLFEVLLFNLTKNLPEQQIYFSRHLVTYLFFVCGIIAFYFLNKRIIRKWQLALLGCLLLVISPRIFGDAFYNSKDIPFLVVFIFSVLTLHLYLEKKKLLPLVIHGITSAILIALRAPGIVMLGLTVGFIILDSLVLQTLKWKKAILHEVVYLGVTALITYIFWPILWHDPFHEIINAFQMMGRFPWDGGVVLYRGNYNDVTNLPWHYIPYWMLISVPLGFIFFAVSGFFGSLVTSIKSGWRTFYEQQRNFLLVSGWLFIPIAVVIMLKSVLYDGWRQMFFIYPAVIVFSVMGVKTLVNIHWLKPSSTFSKILIGLLILLSISEPIAFIVKNHPLEMVYFNQWITLRNTHIRQSYEMDYWGLAYRQGLEYVLSENPGKQVRVSVANYPGKMNAMLLSPPDRERLVYVSNTEQADYFMTNYRYHPEDYDYPDEVFKITILDETVFSVFRISNPK